MKKKRPDFDSRAAEWDKLPRRVALANAVLELIKREIEPQPWMRVLDYGCGTGLVTMGLQPLVKEIIAVDSSAGMLEQLQSKALETGALNLSTFFIDLDKEWKLPAGIDLLVSSMTMHHVPDVAPLLAHFRSVMSPGSWLCISDLEKEDGSFHDDQSSDIPHHGFEIEEMESFFKKAGFSDIKTMPVMNVKKERNEGLHLYPVNLTIGKN